MTPQAMTFDFISDPGHGWLAVTPEQQRTLGVTQDHMTRYSYFDRATGTIYAEEDCDVAVILAAHHRLTGKEPVIRERENSPRHLPACSGNAPAWREAMAYLSAARGA